MTLATPAAMSAAAALRSKVIDLDGHRVLISNLRGSSQEPDLSEPPNCGGLGRIRHYRRTVATEWPEDPLPMDPACRALGLPAVEEVEAQLFQIAGCNWRCWYCFVDSRLLCADPHRAKWLSADQLIDMYLRERRWPSIVILSGGQPDLAPEWVPWMMRELKRRNLDREVYLWSDDNLGTNSFWRSLPEADRELMASHPMYGRVGCFKGFDPSSFKFNTRVDDVALFDEQFRAMRFLLSSGVDVYAYATFTTPSIDDVRGDMARFVDRLQGLDENLPLRTVPLQVKPFSPTKTRLVAQATQALTNQQYAVDAWREELCRRFTHEQLTSPITDIPLSQRRIRR